MVLSWNILNVLFLIWWISFLLSCWEFLLGRVIGVMEEIMLWCVIGEKLSVLLIGNLVNVIVWFFWIKFELWSFKVGKVVFLKWRIVRLCFLFWLVKKICLICDLLLVLCVWMIRIGVLGLRLFGMMCEFVVIRFLLLIIKFVFCKINCGLLVFL